MQISFTSPRRFCVLLLNGLSNLEMRFVSAIVTSRVQNGVECVCSSLDLCLIPVCLYNSAEKESH
jgi:hypothetical protein